MYNVKSNHADEFIDDSEILETLAYAEKNKSNRALIEEIIEKAAKCKGLTHREAAVLLDCDQPDLIARYEQIVHTMPRTRVTVRSLKISSKRPPSARG